MPCQASTREQKDKMSCSKTLVLLEPPAPCSWVMFILRTRVWFILAKVAWDVTWLVSVGC